MHAAHRTVGVAGAAAVDKTFGHIAPFYHVNDGRANDRPPAAPLDVILAAAPCDAKLDASLDVLEALLAEGCNARCRRWNSVGLGRPRAGSNADCVIAIGRWLQVARDWADVDSAIWSSSPTNPAAGGEPDCSVESVFVDVVAEARSHPLVERIGPFVARCRAGTIAHVPADATILLYGHSEANVRPVAWTWRGQRGHVVGTLLDTSEDFVPSGLACLMLNALRWVAGRS